MRCTMKPSATASGRPMRRQPLVDLLELAGQGVERAGVVAAGGELGVDPLLAGLLVLEQLVGHAGVGGDHVDPAEDVLRVAQHDVLEDVLEVRHRGAANLLDGDHGVASVPGWGWSRWGARSNHVFRPVATALTPHPAARPVLAFPPGHGPPARPGRRPASPLLAAAPLSARLRPAPRPAGCAAGRRRGAAPPLAGLRCPGRPGRARPWPTRSGCCWDCRST